MALVGTVWDIRMSSHRCTSSYRNATVRNGKQDVYEGYSSRPRLHDSPIVPSPARGPTRRDENTSPQKQNTTPHATRNTANAKRALSLPVSALQQVRDVRQRHAKMIENNVNRRRRCLRRRGARAAPLASYVPR